MDLFGSESEAEEEDDMEWEDVPVVRRPLDGPGLEDEGSFLMQWAVGWRLSVGFL